MSPPYVGRFAPSPTGALHFGSLVTALGSWLQARHRRGLWLVRIEDIDPPREVEGAADRQIETLRRFGLVSDGPVYRQSLREQRHFDAVAKLRSSGLAYDCACSRRDLPPSGIYPGTCRAGLPDGRRGRSIRVRTDRAEPIRFEDAVQGRFVEAPGERAGDFVIRRADGLIAYQLAVVVDDAADGITEVVRGADLLDSTARQIHLYRCLDLAAPGWMHLPLVVDQQGRKLSKSDADDPVSARSVATALRLALRALGHEPPAEKRSADAIRQWAIRAWDRERIPHGPVAIGVHPS